jgi:hypothetical protein
MVLSTRVRGNRLGTPASPSASHFADACTGKPSFPLYTVVFLNNRLINHYIQSENPEVCPEASFA